MLCPWSSGVVTNQLPPVASIIRDRAHCLLPELYRKPYEKSKTVWIQPPHLYQVPFFQTESLVYCNCNLFSYIVLLLSFYLVWYSMTQMAHFLCFLQPSFDKFTADPVAVAHAASLKQIWLQSRESNLEINRNYRYLCCRSSWSCCCCSFWLSETDMITAHRE